MQRDKIMIWPVLALLAVLMLSHLAQAMTSASYSIKSSVVPSSGGVMTSSSFKMAMTAGQPSIGIAQGESYRAGFGFWGKTTEQYAVYLPMVVRD